MPKNSTDVRKHNRNKPKGGRTRVNKHTRNLSAGGKRFGRFLSPHLQKASEEGRKRGLEIADKKAKELLESDTQYGIALREAGVTAEDIDMGKAIIDAKSKEAQKKAFVEANKELK